MSDLEGLYRRVKWASVVVVLISLTVPIHQTSASAAYSVQDGHILEVQVSLSSEQSENDGSENDRSSSRSRRQATVSSNSQSIVDELNDIRRSVSASNMYYVVSDYTLRLRFDP